MSSIPLITIIIISWVSIFVYSSLKSFFKKINTKTLFIGDTVFSYPAKKTEEEAIVYLIEKLEKTLADLKCEQERRFYKVLDKKELRK